MLTQSEADALFAMQKKPKSGNPLAFPHAGGKLLADLYAICAGNAKYRKGIIYMSALDCYQLVDLYAIWLKERVKLKTIGDVCEPTTPFIDRHNDYLQIYVKATPSGMLLTDDGYTIRDLEMSFCYTTFQE